MKLKEINTFLIQLCITLVVVMLFVRIPTIYQMIPILFIMLVVLIISVIEKNRKEKEAYKKYKKRRSSS